MANDFAKIISLELSEVSKAVEPIGTADLMHIHLHDGVGYSLNDEASIKFNEIVSKLLKHQSFIKKFSSKYVENKLRTIFAKILNDDTLDIEKEITQLITEFKSYNKNHLIYLKIEGIRLSVCFQIGKVRLTPGDEYLLRGINDKAIEIIKLTKNDDISKASFIELIEQESKNEFQGGCVGIVEVNAEPHRAFEIAKEEVRRAIDLLRFASKSLYGLKEDIRIGLKGDHSKTRRQGYIISDSSFNAVGDNVGSVIPFDINHITINKMIQIGVFRISDALEKPQVNILEEATIRSIHWYSVALTQNDKSNSFLFLIVALESLFQTAKGNSIVGTVAESVAFLMSDNLKGRKQIVSTLRDYYGKRSGVAHGGNKTISDTDLHTLTYIVATTIMIVIRKLDEFDNQDKLMNWIEEIKFS